jgi:hypothetical protein
MRSDAQSLAKGILARILAVPVAIGRIAAVVLEVAARDHTIALTAVAPAWSATPVTDHLASTSGGKVPHKTLALKVS